jgi:1,4-alpha-glucan branching enzyme
MWAHPGKKLLFMGCELAQWREWNDDQSLDWHLLDEPAHRGVQTLLSDLNRLYLDEPALWEADVTPAGFEWIDANSAAENIVAFLRNAPVAKRRIVCVCNFSARARPGYRLALPSAGSYRVILNTDAAVYDGSNSVQLDSIEATADPLHLRPYSAFIDLPPLSTVWLEVPRAEERAEQSASDGAGDVSEI